MTPEAQRIAIAEACGWRGQSVKQAWQHKSGFPKYWRSIPIDNSETFDFFSASRVARVLLNPENKPVFRKVYCGILNNRDSYSMVPVVEYFQHEDQYKPWPIIEQSLVPFVEHLPDYLSDLNAMNQAEMLKQMSFNSDYAYWLAHIAVRDRGLNEDKHTLEDGYQIALTATAPQRAEAFLRTIGKWEEGK